jgi:hypothetical protein
VIEAFAGRRLCIATMHGKEAVLAPALESRLGVRCVLPDAGFDTDRFGTFSGEVPRRGTARETARAKARAAMAATAVDLGVASEGSFVPHPEAPLAQLGLELVVLIDLALDLEIVGQDATLETNHARMVCASADDALAFGERIGLPGHGMMLVLGDPPRAVRRGLHDAAEVRLAFDAMRREAADPELAVFAESDMRADRNPTRMRAIGRAAEALAQRAASPCPACGTPGFGEVDAVRGLPCADCGAPTGWVRTLVRGCLRCPVRREVPRPDGLLAVDPASCPHCNP